MSEVVNLITEQAPMKAGAPPLLPRVLVYDEAFPDQGLGMPSVETRLIEPTHAIDWIASGRFGAEPPLLPWFTCAPEDLEREGAQVYGRQQLAEEILVAAITSGRVRCVYVNRAVRPKAGSPWSHMIETIDPAQFAGDIDHDWEEAFCLHIGRDDYMHSVTVSGFMLFWDEVLNIRPNGKRDLDAGFASVIPPATSPPRLPTVERPSVASNRGPRPKNHGAPIAMFLADAIAGDVHSLLQQKDEALGRSLQEKYALARSSPAPSLRNASADARAALEAWVSATGANGAFRAT